MTLPWRYSPRVDLSQAHLSRVMARGFDFVSLTVANDDHDSNTALCAIAEERNYFSQNANRFLCGRLRT